MNALDFRYIYSSVISIMGILHANGYDFENEVGSSPCLALPEFAIWQRWALRSTRWHEDLLSLLDF